MPAILGASLLKTGGICLLAAILGAASAAAEPTGYTVAEGELRRVDLETGEYETIGPTLAPFPAALGALLEDGFFYGLSPEPAPPFPASLYRYDPATGAGERIGRAGALGGHWYLTGAGDALYSADGDGNLYRVDEATAAASAIAATGATALSFFGHDGALYLLDLQGWQLPCVLRRFDLSTQALTTIGPIECADTAAVGDDGFVYLASVLGGVTLTGEPSWGGVEVWRYDFASGETSPFSSWEPVPGKTRIFGLAGIEGGVTIEVPIAGSPGLLLLAAGLAAAGLLLIRR